MSTEPIEQQLQRYITGEVVRGGTHVALDVPLVQSGLIDSLGLLQIVSYVERHFGVDLTQAAAPEDFRTVASLAHAIARIRTASA
jgi:acyl carrier protein